MCVCVCVYIYKHIWIFTYTYAYTYIYITCVERDPPHEHTFGLIVLKKFYARVFIDRNTIRSQSQFAFAALGTSAAKFVRIWGTSNFFVNRDPYQSKQDAYKWKKRHTKKTFGWNTTTYCKILQHTMQHTLHHTAACTKDTSWQLSEGVFCVFFWYRHIHVCTYVYIYLYIHISVYTWMEW